MQVDPDPAGEAFRGAQNTRPFANDFFGPRQGLRESLYRHKAHAPGVTRRLRSHDINRRGP